jgi:hypothetical protein
MPYPQLHKLQTPEELQALQLAGHEVGGVVEDCVQS